MSSSPSCDTVKPPSDCFMRPSQCHLEKVRSVLGERFVCWGSYIAFLSMESSASFPPTVAKARTAAYDAAACEVWPWPPPKPPSEFWQARKVLVTLGSLSVTERTAKG